MASIPCSCVAEITVCNPSPITVFRCINTDGTLSGYYDAEGNTVDPSTFICCNPVEMPTSFTNGSFELPAHPPGSDIAVPDPGVPGWTTVGAPNSIEMWTFPFLNSLGLGGSAYPDGGQQLIELDTGEAFGIFQNVTVPSNTGIVKISYYHHSRQLTGPYTVQAFLGDATLPMSSDTLVDTDSIPGPQPVSAWHHKQAQWVKPAGVTSVRLRFFSTSCGNAGNCNLLDGIKFQFFACP